ncbi:MAG TPA: type II 3-dehydroquinate dehydratase [Myxococcota bacterium]|nr:type II 3-dehydroquinate dehydratase [Myxococcota bacterium]
MSLRIVVLHGPNLNLLGSREPDQYGRVTLDELTGQLDALAVELGVELTHVQSNHEGVLIDEIHKGGDGIVFNPGAYTHTSVALRDALLGTGAVFVEVHISNVHARERFRRRSLLADVAVGMIAGFGADSYLLGLRALVAHLRSG